MSIQDNINKLRMGVSALTDNVMVGILNSENTGFKYKTNLTSDFLKCVIQFRIYLISFYILEIHVFDVLHSVPTLEFVKYHPVPVPVIVTCS